MINQGISDEIKELTESSFNPRLLCSSSKENGPFRTLALAGGFRKCIVIVSDESLDVGGIRITLPLPELEGVSEIGDFTGESRMLLPCKQDEMAGPSIFLDCGLLKAITGDRQLVPVPRMVVLVLEDDDELSSGRKLSLP